MNHRSLSVVAAVAIAATPLGVSATASAATLDRARQTARSPTRVARPG